MTDRELLELAARTAGYQPEMVRPELGGALIDFGDRRVWWNPLIDDGDALRLAVELQLGISIPPVVDGRIDVVTFYGPIISIVEYPQNDDRNAATRRAIVRTAAEVGKGMLTHDEFVLMFPGRFAESEIDRAAAEIGKQRNSYD